MAIICPPNTAPVQPPDNAGWHYRNTQWGTEICRTGHTTRNGLAAWSKASGCLKGATLYQYSKNRVRLLAAAWPPMNPTIKATYTNNAPNYPFTNLRGRLKTGNGFQLWMHCTKGILPFFSIQHGIPISISQVPPAQNFATNIHEADMPTPNITEAHLYADMTWAIKASNWPPYGNVSDFTVLLTLPGQLNIKTATLFAATAGFVDVNDPPLWSNQDNGFLACVLKPYPVGTECLMGLRGFFGSPNVLPTPIALVNITVEPAP